MYIAEDLACSQNNSQRTYQQLQRCMYGDCRLHVWRLSTQISTAVYSLIEHPWGKYMPWFLGWSWHCLGCWCENGCTDNLNASVKERKVRSTSRACIMYFAREQWSVTTTNPPLGSWLLSRTLRHMWVVFALVLVFFSKYSILFFSLLKNQHFKISF